MNASVARGALALAWLLALPSLAAAQVPRVIEPPATVEFLSRFDFLVAIETLSGDDPQFQWDADFGAEFDIVGSPRARVTTSFTYEAILGEELQPFDPNQGNYAIEVVGGRRWGRAEGAIVFHHTSRHLGDRAKDFGIAWNLLGAQVTWAAPGPARAWMVQGRAAKIVMADAVDYTGDFSAHAMYSREVHRRLAVVGRAWAVARTVDADLWGRGTQVGGRLEAALRVRGGAADLEIHAGVERRIEAPIFLPRPITWALLGIRVMSR